MLTTKNLVSDYKDVPVPWIFEHYAHLTEKLSGQHIKIRSLFNERDRFPSMSIYPDKETQVYRFKDFSSGNSGSAIDLVMSLKSLTFGQAKAQIIRDYNEYTLHNNGGYNVEEFKYQSKYQVVEATQRKWTVEDQKFWTQFNIGTKILSKYNVHPLHSYRMEKEVDGINKEVIIQGPAIYGYYKKDGALFKVYQPTVSEKKFIKVQNYVQGMDQREKYECLLIVSSLKDIMSINSLGLKVDMIAPDSENTMVPKTNIDKFLDEYKYIGVLFDNDAAGILAMKKYKEQYGLFPLLLPMSKDVSDSIRDKGPRAVRERLVPLIASISPNLLYNNTGHERKNMYKAAKSIKELAYGH